MGLWEGSSWDDGGEASFGVVSVWETNLAGTTQRDGVWQIMMIFYILFMNDSGFLVFVLTSGLLKPPFFRALLYDIPCNLRVTATGQNSRCIINAI